MASNRRSQMALPLVVMTLLVVTSQAHDWNFGACPSVRPMPNFDLERFLGSWYVVEQYDTSSSCLVFLYERASPTRLFMTKQRQLPSPLDAVGLQHNQYTGVLDIPDAANEARMRVKWPLNIAGKGDYTVYDTDYTSYAAVYDCQQLSPLMHRKNAAILSRTPIADDFLVEELKSKLSTQGVESRHFNKISHDGCGPAKPGVSVGPDTIPDLFNSARDELGDAAKDIGDAATSAIDEISTFFDSIGGVDPSDPSAEAPNLDRSLTNFPSHSDTPLRDEPLFPVSSSTAAPPPVTSTLKTTTAVKITTTEISPTKPATTKPSITTTFAPIFNFKTPGSIPASDAAVDESFNEIDREIQFENPGNVIRTVVSV